MSWRNVDSKGKSECAFQISMDQQLVSWLKSQSLSLSEDWKIGVPCTATICSQFIGRSEHTCGTEPQYSVYSGMIRTQDLQHFHASGRRSEQLSYLLLLYIKNKADLTKLPICTNQNAGSCDVVWQHLKHFNYKLSDCLPNGSKNAMLEGTHLWVWGGW